MYLDMSGKWNISLQEDTGERSGDILLPRYFTGQGMETKSVFIHPGLVVCMMISGMSRRNLSLLRRMG